jgi:hypothetical protein
MSEHQERRIHHGMPLNQPSGAEPGATCSATTKPLTVPVPLDRYTKLVLAAHDTENERQRSELWRKLANGYDNIRSWLRLCEDTPAGHAEFYEECSKIIFPDQFGEPQEDEQ